MIPSKFQPTIRRLFHTLSDPIKSFESYKSWVIGFSDGSFASQGQSVYTRGGAAGYQLQFMNSIIDERAFWHPDETNLQVLEAFGLFYLVSNVPKVFWGKSFLILCDSMTVVDSIKIVQEYIADGYTWAQILKENIMHDGRVLLKNHNFVKIVYQSCLILQSRFSLDSEVRWVKSKENEANYVVNQARKKFQELNAYKIKKGDLNPHILHYPQFPRSKTPFSLLLSSLKGIESEGQALVRREGYEYLALSSGYRMPKMPEKQVHGLPDGARITSLRWSNNGQNLAFTVRVDEDNGGNGKLQLWVANVETGQAKPLFHSAEVYVNAVFDNFVWMDDSTLLVCTIPSSHGDPPKKPFLPPVPKIQTNELKNTIQLRTFQDLLKDEYDEDLFDYYATSQLVLVSLNGTMKHFGPPAVYTSLDPSPDAKYIMISSTHRPYSYLVPYHRFPKKVDLWTADGKFVRQLCDLPLEEDVPIAHNSVQKGMRSIIWRADRPSTIYWVDTQDGGDAKVEASLCDIVYTQPAEASEGEEPAILHQLDL